MDRTAIKEALQKSIADQTRILRAIEDEELEENGAPTVQIAQPRNATTNAEALKAQEKK